MKNLGRKLLSVGVSMLMMSNCGSVVNCSAFGNNGNCDKIVTGMNENFNRTLGLLNEEISGYKLKMTAYERKIGDLENARDEALNKLNYCEKDPICKNALECAADNQKFCKNMKNDETTKGTINHISKVIFAIAVAHLAFPRLRNFGGVFQMQVHF